MQKAIRLNENQLQHLASKAKQENTLSGYLYKKSTDTGKWQLRWFALYQNLLFYYESDTSTKPSGVALLEGCYCERLITPSCVKGKDSEKQVGVKYSFAIYYRPENLRQYELRNDTEAECNAWVDAIKTASYSKVLEQKEELEQKHLHLLQILDSERQAKWQYVQQCEELTTEVKKLKNELKEHRNEIRFTNHLLQDVESDELKKIKKVQSFFRGWLCRRRWKQIVDEYIRSEHAESMRKRNSIVFGMVECEEEYVRQLSTLVSCFLRPFRMAASSKKPPITHEDVNSVFLNSETVLFLHQIFLKGLSARMENWPTLVLGDLFDMLLPMLGIYQEYVRNHHFSLQVLAEYKQKLEFNALLKRYEEKPTCEGRSLETFLTYPMHQIPRYIITLHELLAHTPHDHVERKKLEFAKGKLEELSHIMHDEVSETENIRKNLSIERMIVEGCDILLDVNQTFVRQGSLLQVINDRSKSGRGRLGSFGSSFKESKKEQVRQVFLFTYHMLLTTRASNGRLHLCKHYGKISLADCTLVEDSSSDVFFFDEDTSSVDTQATSGHGGSTTNLLSTSACDNRSGRIGYNGLDFRLIVDTKSGPPVTITMVASTLQEKAAWCSDVSQCIENLHYSDLLNSSMSDTSSVTMPQSVSSLKLPRTPPSVARLEHRMLCECDRTKARSDPKLFRDDTDIKFSRALNSCKVPKIRHASVDRLLERLTDLRFLSIDFLNTFLLTYRVFTTGRTVLEALRRVVINPEYGNLDHKRYSTISVPPAFEHHHHNTSEVFSTSPPNDSPAPGRMTHLIKPQPEKARRISTDEKNQPASVHKLERAPSDEKEGLHPPYKHKPLAPIASSETLYDQDPDNLSCSSTAQSAVGHSPPALDEEEEDDMDDDDSPPPGMFTLSEAPGESCSDLVPPPPTPATGSTETLNQIGTVNIEEPAETEEAETAPTQEPESAPTQEPESAPTQEQETAPTHEQETAPTQEPETAPTDEQETAPTHEQETSPTPPKVTIVEPIKRVSITEPVVSVVEPSDDDDESADPVISVVEPPEEQSLEARRSDSITDPTISVSVSVTEPEEDDEPPAIPEPRISVTEPVEEEKVRRMDSLSEPVVTMWEPLEEEEEEEEEEGRTDMPRISVVEPQVIETQVVEPTIIEPAASVETLVPESPTSTAESCPCSPATPVTATRPRKFEIPPAIHIPDDASPTSTSSPKYVRAASPVRRNSPVMQRAVSPIRRNSPVMHRVASPCSSPKQKRPPSPISYSFSSPSINVPQATRRSSSIKPATDIDNMSTFSPRSSIAAGAEGSPPPTKVGAVVTSSRASKRSKMLVVLEGGSRRSSSTAAASAFAVATAGAANPPSGNPRGINRFHSAGQCDIKPLLQKRQSVITTAATMKVLNVLKHWVARHSQDFDSDAQLKQLVKDLLEDMVCNSNLLPAEHKAAASILKTILKEDHDPNKVDLGALLAPPSTVSRDSFDSLSALDIAEQLTYLDHQIFKSIRSEELLGQSWMKCDKGDKAPHVLLVSKRFNEVSRLVVSEVVGRVGIMDRVSCIEKWAAIADICRCMHNYNGVLQICAAFVNSSVYRLKRTWDRIPKQTKQMIERLQTLVSSDGRFKNMRDALHRCDPPCIPYLGMYLTDLSFIEEGTPNVTDESLVNFSKMRMIAHVIREIQLFQQTPYRIEHHPRVTSYLLDDSRLLEEEETYRQSLLIEPRQSIARPLASTITLPQT